MEINSIPFNEKKFILAILSVLNKKYGNEQRFIFDHKFVSIDVDIIPYISEFKNSDDVGIRNKSIMYWFKEAETRKLLQYSKGAYQITEQGYNRALGIKHPVKTFFKNHLIASFAAGVTLTASLINLIAAIIRANC